MTYYCNPLNLRYLYQKAHDRGDPVIYRESADPSLILFKGKYYLFPSLAAGFYSSDDMVSWTHHSFRQEMPVVDYAPDVRAVGEYLYFSASTGADRPVTFYRTRDVFNEPFEAITGSFDAWDPNLFWDDDGRLYYYWGCSPVNPTYGVELDLNTMKPIGTKKELIFCRRDKIGFERYGEDHSMDPVKSTFTEGSWMTKHNGKYYLQYATPGTEYNVYSDGVYVSDSPLGPFTVCASNPYSYFPSGFITGAGHGSTIQDKNGNYWHIATMRISRNHMFERRLGIWRAGFDPDGNLYCDQRYGDWPRAAEDAPFTAPRWYPLYLNASACASSGKYPERGISENIREWWSADSNKPGEWLCEDLGKVKTVHAVQINFADEGLTFVPDGISRRIDETRYYTRWKLEASVDGSEYFTVEDKSEADTDLVHDLVVREDGFLARFLRLTVYQLAYDQPARVSGLRVFGLSDGPSPAAAEASAVRTGPLDMQVTWSAPGASGVNILWGIAPDKLYHSCLCYGIVEKNIGALMADSNEIFVRVDAFNESGLTEGRVFRVNNR